MLVHLAHALELQANTLLPDSYDYCLQVYTVFRVVESDGQQYLFPLCEFNRRFFNGASTCGDVNKICLAVFKFGLKTDRSHKTVESKGAAF